jgi:hypothetical protein
METILTITATNEELQDLARQIVSNIDIDYNNYTRSKSVEIEYNFYYVIVTFDYHNEEKGYYYDNFKIHIDDQTLEQQVHLTKADETTLEHEIIEFLNYKY